MKLKVVQPTAGDVFQVVSESPCTEMKVVRRGNSFWAMKFVYANGAVLYVPMPDDRTAQAEQDLEISLGPAIV
jgi:hypothetical protein